MQLAVKPTDQIQLADMPKIALRVRGLDAAGDDDPDERKTGVGDEIAHASADASRVHYQLGGWRAPVAAQRRRRHHGIQPIDDIDVAEAAHAFDWPRRCALRPQSLARCWPLQCQESFSSFIFLISSRNDLLTYRTCPFSSAHDSNDTRQASCLPPGYSI